MTSKYDLISKLTYKAYVLSNAASEIGKLQDEISEATAELPDVLDKIGAVLVGPYDEYPSIKLAQAKAKIRQLEQEIAHLQQYKDKWVRILEMC